MANMNNNVWYNGPNGWEDWSAIHPTLRPDGCQQNPGRGQDDGQSQAAPPGMIWAPAHPPMNQAPAPAAAVPGPIFSAADAAPPSPPRSYPSAPGSGLGPAASFVPLAAPLAPPVAPPVAAPLPVPTASLPPVPPAAPPLAPGPAPVLLPGATLAPLPGGFKPNHLMLDQVDRDQIAQWASTLARPAFVNAVANRFPLPPWNFGTIPHRNPNSTKHVWTKAEILVILYEWEHGIFAEHSWAWANKPTGFGWLPWIRRRLEDWGFTGRTVNACEHMKMFLFRPNDPPRAWQHSPGLKRLARRLIEDGVDERDPAPNDGHAGVMKPEPQNLRPGRNGQTLAWAPIP